MDFNKMEIKTCKYKFDSFKIEIPGFGLYDVEPESILNIILEKEYDTHFFPYFEVTLQVSNKALRAMRKNYADCKAIISMKYALVKSDISGSQKENHVWQTFFNKKFVVFMDKGSPDLNEDNIKQYEQDAQMKNDTITTQDVGMVQLALYNEDYLLKTKKIINKVLTSPTLSDTIAYVCNTARLSKILMTPLNNNQIPHPYIIHPVTALEQLVYLVDNYVAHKTGTIVFFDLTRGYIIDKKPECTAWEPNEYKVTYLIAKSDENKEAATREGCYIDSKSKCNIINIVPTNMEMNNGSYMNDQIKGNNVTIIDSKTGATTKVSSGAKSKISGSTNYLYDDKCSGKSASVLQHELEECNATGTISMHGVHIGLLNPNLQYILNISNSKYKQYNGNYRITSMKATFQKDGDCLVPNVVITIKGNKG